ncbi:SDR family NAD(P)-dependent oxidoreductase [Streptococcus tangpeifui]|uniref:SDR family NAD(P)-dependent oxidoreductase n=1 Tax=Streptococcus tangpeifui TaxID=2709400 RepID=UPI0013ED3FB2|nr:MULTISPECIES: SDR family NAD(P)-dependent oxidoreductase [unclassified Streptococcus]
MTKTILITGSTDGIGKHLAAKLASEGHEVILHGRNPNKLQATLQEIKENTENARLHTYLADLCKLSDTLDMMKAITKKENWVSQKGHSVVMTA